MGIQISNPVSRPAIVYDKIHMTSLEIIQPTYMDDSANPMYQVVINYRHYGVVEGARYYANEELQRVSIQDFITMAMTKAGGGDMSLLNALGSIETAVAGIITDQTGETATQT